MEDKSMSNPDSTTYPIYLETGDKRTFAGALAWPGWCRGARSEQAALQALLDYAPRYAAILHRAQLELPLPASLDALTVVERLEGNRSTDFGAPAIAPADDARPLDTADLHRFRALLEAGWHAFDAARVQATGRELRKGPRGGGRELDAIVNHVIEADLAYLGRVGHKPSLDSSADPEEALRQTRQATLAALEAAVRGELPTSGPRGGQRWTARYFVRRVAWHLLDHTWELEDRIL